MKQVNECVTAPVATLDTTVGVGNVTPPKSAAFTGAEQSGTDSIGSGDLLGGPTKKYGVYKKAGKKKIPHKKDLTYNDAVKTAKSLNEKENTDIYQIYKMG